MILRDVLEADLPILFEYQREPAANRMAAFPPRDRDAFMKHWRENVLRSPGAIKKTIAVEGQVVGDIGSWESEGERLVGYWIGESFWGRGIATAALTEFLTHHDRTRPIHAHVAVANIGSIRVLEKCGFRAVGDRIVASDGVEELRMARLTA